MEKTRFLMGKTHVLREKKLVFSEKTGCGSFWSMARRKKTIKEIKKTTVLLRTIKCRK